MKLKKQLQKLHGLLSGYGSFLLVLATVACVSVIAMERVDALYVLTGAGDRSLVLDRSAEEETASFSSQLVYLDRGVGGFEVTLRSGQTVTIRHNGAILTAQAQEETVSALLNRLHIAVSPLDMVLVDLSGNGTELTVAEELTYYDRISESVAYETVRIPDPELPQGTEQVTQPGVNGTRTAVYEVVCSGGAELSRQFVEEIDSTAVDEVIHCGTAVETVSASDRIASVTKNDDGSGLLTFQSGATMKFSQVKSMTATAYTAGSGGADHSTATGTAVHVGVVAVDKRVIPLGTKMYILTSDGRIVYGVAVAEDTGVRGNVVDLYYDTYTQCINFGRRTCTVYLLQ